ncbi:MAG: ParB N-terminal domain-containing protein, partial [Caldiserica bacterium]|nr:ParB N-terminal domain-containing protein [Caldisericota bacterium]
MAKIAEFREPLLGHTLEIEMVPVEELEVIEIQRKPSQYHVKRLADSIRKLGFLVPVIGIRRDGRVVIIDGQHRYLAARELGIGELPVIVVPEKLAYDLMELNVEKQMSLREKAYVSLNVYRWYRDVDPGRPETDLELRDAIESVHYVTLGLAYEKAPKLFGSAYESILHRVDRWLDLPLSEALPAREERAAMVLEVERLVREAVAKLQELGVNHPFLPRAVVSFANPIGRKRIIEE